MGSLFFLLWIGSGEVPAAEVVGPVCLAAAGADLPGARAGGLSLPGAARAAAQAPGAQAGRGEC